MYIHVRVQSLPDSVPGKVTIEVTIPGTDGSSLVLIILCIRYYAIVHAFIPSFNVIRTYLQVDNTIEHRLSFLLSLVARI